MNHEHPIVTPHDVERYHREARRMQSREMARLVGLLFRVPARLLRRGRIGTSAAPTERPHAA